MTTLSLNPDIHFCELNGSYVFLDVRSDRYFTLCRDHAENFAEICDAPDTKRLTENARALSSQLRRAGILDFGIDARRSIKPHDQGLPRTEMDVPQATASTGQSTAFFAIALCAFLQTSVIFKTGGFKRTIKKSLQWRDRTFGSDHFSVSEVVGIADRFMRLAPIFFSTKDACLYRSFFLLRCLAFKGINVTWEFGVQLPPFGAHCWLEFRRHPLNDHPDNIQRYTRIMSV